MFFTPEEHKQLLENGFSSRSDHLDHKPVVKLFTPDAGCTWLLTELYPDNPTIAFGLCDLGMGFPELGDVSLEELATARGTMGLPIEKDLHFTATKTISEYARESRSTQQIVA